VKNEEVLHRAKEERNIPHTIKRRKANWIGHILRRNFLIKHVIEGKKKGTERRGRKRRKDTGCPYGNEKILEIERGST
jgi:hypothetical protein